MRNAVRIGAAADPTPLRSQLASGVFGDHLYCFAAMAGVIVLQVAAPLLAALLSQRS